MANIPIEILTEKFTAEQKIYFNWFCQFFNSGFFPPPQSFINNIENFFYSGIIVGSPINTFINNICYILFNVEFSSTMNVSTTLGSVHFYSRVNVFLVNTRNENMIRSAAIYYDFNNVSFNKFKCPQYTFRITSSRYSHVKAIGYRITLQ